MGLVIDLKQHKCDVFPWSLWSVHRGVIGFLFVLGVIKKTKPQTTMQQRKKKKIAISIQKWPWFEATPFN